MLRISSTESEDEGRILLRLEGDITGQWVEELRRACDDAVAPRDCGARLVLDLRDVRFIDARGVLLFQQLSGRAAFTNCSPFVAEQLKGVANGSC